MLRAPIRRFSSSAFNMSSEQFQTLAKYTACDISDALLKLNVPGAGFLADIAPLKSKTPARVVAPASTVLFAPKTSPSFPQPVGPKPDPDPPSSGDGSKISPGTPYADLINQNTIAVLSQPEGQVCAVVGGINAVRMEQLGAKGVVVSGRVRDVDALKGLKMQVWSRGTSSVGAGAQASAFAVGYPLTIGQVVVNSGDIIMLDADENSVVAIPKDKVEEVLKLLPKLTEADDRCMADVRAGGSVKEAFAKHRGK
ncbi:DlpA domain-containing protein [Phyllosticta citribraziliensis]|uniref:DlpA domain-containing protein n=1 Tax=Phyllosticta citribraziliensis TaxID=989973 RepID=A0ABR1LEY3_9PEZI